MMINKNNEYELHRPKNSWDMNYHLIELNTRKDHLIDICDVADHKECIDDNVELEEYEDYLDWEILRNLSDMEIILDHVWKIV